MVVFLSLLCGLFALLVVLSRFLPEAALFASLPLFFSTAAALVGVLIAGLEYRARKGRKKRRTPMALIVLNTLIGIAATALWLQALLTGA